MEQLLLALDFFHQKKVVHRDIKLENILVNQVQEDQYEVKLADFGLSAITHNNQLLLDICGTPGYIAPEILKKKGYSYKSDIFSLGSVFFNLLSGRYVFGGINSQEVLQKNYQCDFDEKQMIQQIDARAKVRGETISDGAKELLLWMLKASATERPSAKEALNHRLFNSDHSIINDLLKENEYICSHKDSKSNCSNSSRSYNASVLHP